MPLFAVTKTTLSTVDQTNFATEKDLQTLIERNLESVFGCRFVATEFPTGVQHAGRIDTLALSEDNNPVIIEYKKVESSELVNQSLFYLAWIQDHRGDFEIAAQKSLGRRNTRHLNRSVRRQSEVGGLLCSSHEFAGSAEFSTVLESTPTPRPGEN